MPVEMEINLDEGKIFLADKWYNVTELKGTIKKKVDSDDFDVANFSKALKMLKTEIDSYKVITLKVPNNLLDAYSNIAKEAGIKIGKSICRHAAVGLVRQGGKRTAGDAPAPADLLLALFFR